MDPRAEWGENGFNARVFSCAFLFRSSLDLAFDPRSPPGTSLYSARCVTCLGHVSQVHRAEEIGEENRRACAVLLVRPKNIGMDIFSSGQPNQLFRAWVCLFFSVSSRASVIGYFSGKETKWRRNTSLLWELSSNHLGTWGGGGRGTWKFLGSFLENSTKFPEFSRENSGIDILGSGVYTQSVS